MSRLGGLVTRLLAEAADGDLDELDVVANAVAEWLQYARQGTPQTPGIGEDLMREVGGLVHRYNQANPSDPVEGLEEWEGTVWSGIEDGREDERREDREYGAILAQMEKLLGRDLDI